MSYIQAIALAIVQGLGEFLPISSSGHLALVPALLGWDLPHETAMLAFDVMLHLGTLLAVFIYFRSDIVRILTALFSRKPEKAADKRLGWLIIAATAVTVAFALVFDGLVTDIAGAAPEWQVFIVGCFMLLTTFVLLFSEFLSRREAKVAPLETDAAQLPLWKALIVGAGQGIAVFPGLSRSGTTISVALGVGLSREEATRFSFLLSIPIIIAAAVKTILLDVVLEPAARETFIASSGGWGVLIVGFVVAAVVGYAAIRFMIPFVKKHSLGWFAIYTGAVGVITIIWSLAHGVVG